MKTILIIEDNQDVRENLAEILHLSSYNVITAPNGILGVETALKEIPDLILCDIMMPELDGYGVLKILNKNPKTTNIPFIFLTAKVSQNDFRKGMMLGASDFLTKPCTDLDLLEAIEVRLKKNDQLLDAFQDNIFDKNLKLKKEFSSDQWEEVLVLNEKRHYPKKSIIFEVGQYPKWLFYIKKGKVKCTLLNDEGKEFITSICTAGDFVGFAAMINETKYMEKAFNRLLCNDTWSIVLYLNKNDVSKFKYSDYEILFSLSKYNVYIISFDQKLIFHLENNL
jgi:CheY-like chemotaxis protein